MKKSLIIILVFLAILSVSAFGADRVDMIVLLDNSVSVLPYYDDIQESLLKRIISEHLNPGDTFSLLTFADYPEVEISREIKNDGDIQEILNYSTVLQPMGNYTDLVLALRFLYKYSLDLPLSNRKKIVILTDGIHDPPPGSPYLYDDPAEAESEIKKAADDIHREGWDVSIVEIEQPGSTGALERNPGSSGTGLTDSSETSGAVGDNTAAAGNTGGTAGGDAAEPERNNENGSNLLDAVSESLGSEPNVFSRDESDMAGIALGIPLVSVPEDLGATSGDLSVPLTIVNRANSAILFSLSAVIADSSDILSRKDSIRLEPKQTAVLNIDLTLPEDLAYGSNSLEARLKLVGGLETQPESIVLNFEFIEKSGIARGFELLADWRFIAVLAGIIIAVIVIILVKKAPVSAAGPSAAPVRKKSDAADYEYNESVAAEVADEISSTGNLEAGKKGKTRRPEEYLIAAMTTDTEDTFPVKKNRPIQMLVYGQNTKLGISNVKWLGVNRKRSIGSSASSIFRIFFLKVPAVIAYLECSGDDFIFTPEKNDYFPDLDGPMNNCLNKRIRVVNSDGHMFFIEFRQWISELEKVNRVLSLTRQSGLPDRGY